MFGCPAFKLPPNTTLSTESKAAETLIKDNERRPDTWFANHGLLKQITDLIKHRVWIINCPRKREVCSGGVKVVDWSGTCHARIRDEMTGLGRDYYKLRVVFKS